MLVKVEYISTSRSMTYFQLALHGKYCPWNNLEAMLYHGICKGSEVAKRDLVCREFIVCCFA